MSSRDELCRAAVGRLYDAYATELIRLCALYLKDAHLARDAVQDTFLNVYRHYDKFRGEASEKTWLISIAVNVCRGYLRSAWFRRVDRREDALDAQIEDDTFTFPDNTVLEEVMRLKPRLREAVLLRFYSGMKLRDIALSLHVSESTVRARLNKAESILRVNLEEWYNENK